MKKNVKDLQPWLDYFEMLQQYEQRGFLDVQAKKHEAYVTQPALHAMTEGDDPQEQLRSGAIAKTVRRIRAFAGYKSQEEKDYLKQNFAVHVVQDTEPHDLLYTVLMSRRHWPLYPKDKIEVIDYRRKP